MTAKQAISWLTLKPKDLPVFVLIATDPLAPAVITKWCTDALNLNVPRKKIIGASKTFAEFVAWPDKKFPG